LSWLDESGAERGGWQEVVLQLLWRLRALSAEFCCLGIGDLAGFDTLVRGGSAGRIEFAGNLMSAA
jgi:hypothetical protein